MLPAKIRIYDLPIADSDVLRDGGSAETWKHSYCLGLSIYCSKTRQITQKLPSKLCTTLLLLQTRSRFGIYDLSINSSRVFYDDGDSVKCGKSLKAQNKESNLRPSDY